MTRNPPIQREHHRLSAMLQEHSPGRIGEGRYSCRGLSEGSEKPSASSRQYAVDCRIETTGKPINHSNQHNQKEEQHDVPDANSITR